MIIVLGYIIAKRKKHASKTAPTPSPPQQYGRGEEQYGVRDK
jgi:hypothetical protein